MSCTNPRLAVKLPGQKKLHFLARITDNVAAAEKTYGKENVFLIPCGHCSSCVLAKRKEWSVRCVMESKYHQNNCFLTITYDDDHLPGRVQKKDLQRFIHDLRDYLEQKIPGTRIKYFACGEYGEKTLRPHYHAIIFGYWPEDGKFYSESKSGGALFTSDELTKIWNKGFIVASPFTANTAGYVAGYVNKKFGKNDGFLMMSTRPGLGAQYLKDHAELVLKYNCLTDDFGIWKNVSVPRYFEAIAKQLGLEDQLEKLKENRREQIDERVLALMRDHNLSVKEQVIKLNKIADDNRLAKLRREL